MSLVSIVSPLHNKGRYVEDMVRSVLLQSHSEWELIVVENGSTDGGPELVRGCKDPRVRLIQAPQGVAGPGAARNLGIEEAVGDSVLFLDADDLIEPTHLEELVSVAAKSGASIVASGWTEVPDGSPNERKIKHPIGRGQTDMEIADQAIAFAPWAVHCALVKAECLHEPNRWVVELDRYPSEDTAFWFRLVSQFSVAYSEGNTAAYRTETDNFRNQFDDVEKWFAAMEAVTRSNLEFVKQRGKNPTAKQAENLMRLWADVAERAGATGNSELAESAFQLSQNWLEQCHELGGVDTWPLRTRSLLSVKRFHRWKGFLRRKRRI